MKRLLNEFIFTVGPLLFLCSVPLMWEEKPWIAAGVFFFSLLMIVMRFFLYVRDCTPETVSLKMLWMDFEIPNRVSQVMEFPVGVETGLLVSFHNRGFPKGLLFAPFTIKRKTVLEDLIRHGVVPEACRNLFYVR